MQAQSHRPPNLAGIAALTGLLAWAALESGPLTVRGEIQPWPAVLGAIAAIGCVRLVIECLNRAARFIDWQMACRATGKEGTARWGTLKDIRAARHPENKGPFWGRMLFGKKAPLFIDYASNSMTVAPAGSGKGIYTVITNAISIRHSKVLADFKGELVCILKTLLEKRGEAVRVLNPGGLWHEIIGDGERYNPLDIIVDSLRRPGGLRDIPDDLREMCAQIYPEPEAAETDNNYFREGGRRSIADAMLLEAMIEEYDATLSSVALLIENRQALEHNLRWVVGVDLDGKPLANGAMPIEQTEWAGKHDPQDVAEFARLVRARAANLLALMTTPDSRTFDSFISGAQQALAPFAFGRLSPAMGRSTFSMDELKDGGSPTTLFIVSDASRPEAYKAFNGLVQWCALTAMKRHDNKDTPVYFIMDEATNYKINGLENLLTWGRSYGVRLHLIFQDLSAFERVYGEKALETLLSETEIKQFLPGQRSPKTLELIEKMLGNCSMMMAGYSKQEPGQGLHEQLSESGRPLLTADEVRRCLCGLLFVRQAPPLTIEPVSYASVHPWRIIAGINPFHGKAFLQKVKIRLRD